MRKCRFIQSGVTLLLCSQLWVELNLILLQHRPWPWQPAADPSHLINLTTVLIVWTAAFQNLLDLYDSWWVSGSDPWVRKSYYLHGAEFNNRNRSCCVRHTRTLNRTGSGSVWKLTSNISFGAESLLQWNGEILEITAKMHFHIYFKTDVGNIWPKGQTWPWDNRHVVPDILN